MSRSVVVTGLCVCALAVGGADGAPRLAAAGPVWLDRGVHVVGGAGRAIEGLRIWAMPNGLEASRVD